MDTEEAQTQRANCKLYSDFQLFRKSVPLTPTIVQAVLKMSEFYTFIKSALKLDTHFVSPLKSKCLMHYKLVVNA